MEQHSQEFDLDEECTTYYHMLLKCIQKYDNNTFKTLLQKQESHCDVIGKVGIKLLQHAVKYGNSEMVQNLINNGCNVNAQDSSKSVTLISAIQKNNAIIVDILLNNNADIYATDFSGANSLQVSAQACIRMEPKNMNKSVEFSILKKIFERLDKDFLTNKNTTTQKILDASDVVKHAVVSFGHVELAEIILQNGYPINFEEPICGFIALQCAIIFTKIKNAMLLIERGCNGITNFSRYSILGYYKFNCQYQDENSLILKSLLKHTVDWHLTNKRGYSDLELLLKFGNKNCVRTVLQEVIRIGIHVRTESHQLNNIFLRVVCDTKDSDVIHVLEDFYTPLNIKLKDQYPVLSLASHCGNVKAVEFSLNHGADPQKTMYGESFLASIFMNINIKDSRNGDMEQVIELLLQHGANAQILIYRECLLEYLFESQKTHSIESFVGILVANFAWLDDSLLKESTRRYIQSQPLLKFYFNYCNRQLSEMKYIKVHGEVKMFELLNATDEKILSYARDRNFPLAMKTKLNEMTHIESYYLNALRRKLSKAINTIQKVVTVIDALIGIDSDTYYHIVYNIIKYLDTSDLYRLRNEHYRYI